MTKKDKKYISDCIMSEGFDYTFIHYSSFDDIKDDQFHELRKAYADAQEKLQEYLVEQGIELDY